MVYHIFERNTSESNGGHNHRILVPFWEMQSQEESPKKGHCWIQTSPLSRPLSTTRINPLNDELNPICHLLVLLAHYILHVSRIRVKYRNKPASEEHLKLPLSPIVPDFNKSWLHRNSQFRHTDKSTCNNFRCITDWLNLQCSFCVIVPDHEWKIKPTVCVTFLTLPVLPIEKQRWGSVKYLESGKGFHKPESLKSAALFCSF